MYYQVQLTENIWIFEILSSRFFTIFFRKFYFTIVPYGYTERWEIDMQLLYASIIRKPYMESQMTPSYLTLSNLDSQSQGNSDFEALYVVKEQSWAIWYH